MSISVPSQAYAELTDVYQLLPGRSYSASTKPSEAQAEQAVKDVAAQINARLRALGYSTPLTDTSDILVLKHINALGAAAHCEQATLGVVQGESPIAEAYRDEYMTFLKDLQDGKFNFEGAGDPSASEAEGPEELEASGSRADPVFVNSESERKTQF